jgi:hypothetical protein
VRIQLIRFHYCEFNRTRRRFRIDSHYCNAICRGINTGNEDVAVFAGHAVARRIVGDAGIVVYIPVPGNVEDTDESDDIPSG